MIKIFCNCLLCCLLFFCACNSSNKENLKKNGISKFNEGKYEEAVKEFNKFIQLDSSDYSIWIYRGKAFFSLKNETEASLSWNKAITLEPTLKEGYGYRGILYHYQKKNDLALTDINKAIKGNISDTMFLLVRASILEQKGQLDAALKDCNTLLKYDTLFYDALLGKASVYKSMGQFQRAKQIYDIAIKTRAGDPIALNNRAMMLEEENNYIAAIEDYSKAIEFSAKEDDVHAFAYNNRGLAYFKVDSLTQALKDITYSIQLMPKNSYAYRNRAIIEIATNKAGEACADLHKALTLEFSKDYGPEVDKLFLKHCKSRQIP